MVIAEGRAEDRAVIAFAARLAQWSNGRLVVLGVLTDPPWWGYVNTAGAGLLVGREKLFADYLRDLVAGVPGDVPVAVETASCSAWKALGRLVAYGAHDAVIAAARGPLARRIARGQRPPFDVPILLMAAGGVPEPVNAASG